MEYRVWPELEARTSLLGFGCMRFPMDGAQRVQREEAAALVRRALEAGINYFDTAYPYHDGQSEELLGEALSGVPRERYYLATKLPVWKVESLEDAERLFTEQQKRLRTGCFDFYLLHALNRKRWGKMLALGVVDWCVRKQKEGAIRRLGFSFHDNYAVLEEILSFRKWDFCQLQLNYLDTNSEDGSMAGLEGYRLAERLGVPVVVMEPVKGGLLADVPKDLTAELQRPEASDASWALRWAGSLPGVLTVLSGMSTMEQLEDNLATFQGFQPLKAEETARLEQVAAGLRLRVKNGCTACRYCMPCPAGVDIPENFKIWNLMAMSNSGGSAWRPWNVNMEESSKGAHCVRCGRCVALCPQGIPIPDDLARAQAELDRIPQPN